MNGNGELEGLKGQDKGVFFIDHKALSIVAQEPGSNAFK